MIRVGLSLNFENAHRYTDREVYEHTLGIADLAEELGFDVLSVTEHHFNGAFSLSPDPITELAYIAGRTHRIELLTAAVILPWNDPVRVAERISLLDNLANGRVILGMGRGLSCREFEGFGVPMSESRGRFDEAAPMIMRALSTGWIEGAGPFYPQKRVEIHPVPTRPFADRIYSIGAGSSESVAAAARLGAGLMLTIQRQLIDHHGSIELYRDTFRDVHGMEASLPLIVGFPMYCHRDGEVARARAREWTSNYYDHIVRHYDYDRPETFKGKSGYEAYTRIAEQLSTDAGLDAAKESYFSSGIYGSPEEILLEATRIHEAIGDFTWLCAGGVPYPEHAESVTLFAREVLPELKKLAPKPPRSRSSQR